MTPVHYPGACTCEPGILDPECPIHGGTVFWRDIQADSDDTRTVLDLAPSAPTPEPTDG